MKAILSIAATVLLLALLSFGLYHFNDTQEPAQQSSEPAITEILNQTEEQGRPSEHREKAARQAAADAAAEAEQARQLLEQALARSENERQQALAQLESQLEAEAQARQRAEQAVEEMRLQVERAEQQQQAMQQQRRELLARQQALAAESPSEPDPAVAVLVEQITARESSVEQLVERERELQVELQQARERQWQAEDRLIEAGGQVESPLPRVWSPNYRPLR